MNNFINKSSLQVTGKSYNYYSIKEAAAQINRNLEHLPFSLKILFENLVRNYDEDTVNKSHLEAIFDSVKDKNNRIEIAYRPARVLMQDFTGVPAVVDLASMRDACVRLGQDPTKINPLVPVDLVIDHSVQVDSFGNANSYQKNVDLEFARNQERYEFLKWARESFENFRVVPPGTGICHQVNLENLAQVIWQNNDNLLYPDTVVGTDSHTTMINGLGVLGWGVGGIEAEAAMLGQPVSMLIPEVIGFKLTGKLPNGITATDLVLTITEILRKKGVVGKFVEFFGPALKDLSLANRATIANMAPEYGATCGIFPIDQITLDYLDLTARSKEQIEIVKKYCQEQGMFLDDYNYEAQYSQIVELDLSNIKPSLAGPKRPQDRVNLEDVASSIKTLQTSNNDQSRYKIPALNSDIGNGDVLIAAITSCTNTSNPSVLIAAGLMAKKANELGLKVKPTVKTSLAPGSQVVSEYLEKSGLQDHLDQLGFNVVGYGCTTCIGNSGPLHDEIEKTIKDNNLIVGSVLSGNRNFEGRVHQLVKANYLASPPLVVAYALAGTLNIDLSSDVIATDKNGNDVYLKDLWPQDEEISQIINQNISREVFAKKYANLFDGDETWQKIKVNKSQTYDWNQNSTYIRLPNFFDNLGQENAKNIENSRILATFADSITTDHISPAGSIALDSPAAKYLKEHNINPSDFNSYGSRRGNHEVMMRGTFANIRIKNQILGGKREGGYTKIYNSNDEVTIFDAANYYKHENTSLVVFAGKEYGTGSSRDWAAKGTMLLGVKAVIAESFERIHRSNLIGMGVLPLCFNNNENINSLNITGNEKVDILGIDSNIKPLQNLELVITSQDGSKIKTTLTCRLDTSNEVNYYKSGGILQFVLNNI